MKKIFILLLIIFVIGYSEESIKNISNTKNSSTLNKSRYVEKSSLIKLDSLDILKNTTTKIVYFGRDTCPICQIYKPILEEIVNEVDTKVYYFDTDYWRAKNEFNDILEYYNIDGIPNLIHINEDGSFIKQELSEKSKKYDNEELLKKEIKKFIIEYKEN